MTLTALPKREQCYLVPVVLPHKRKTIWDIVEPMMPTEVEYTELVK